MKNPFSDMFEKVDDTIMYGVNKGIKAWNWTTGQTKTDLANQLLTLAPIFDAIGSFYGTPYFGAIASPLFLFISHMQQKINYRQQIEEQRAKDKKTRLSLDNEYEHRNKSLGYFWGGAGAFPLSSLPNCEEPVIVLSYSISNGFRSASHFIMRADDLPPRKNVFARAKDKLVEKINEGKLNPVFQPALNSVNVRTCLDNYF